MSDNNTDTQTVNFDADIDEDVTEMRVSHDVRSRANLTDGLSAIVRFADAVPLGIAIYVAYYFNKPEISLYLKGSEEARTVYSALRAETGHEVTEKGTGSSGPTMAGKCEGFTWKLVRSDLNCTVTETDEDETVTEMRETTPAQMSEVTVTRKVTVKKCPPFLS
jgi:hypothetical protein